MADTVRLMHYDPRWPQEFQQTRSGILHSCLGWVIDVQHIGSTAIGGMISRPVLDVVAAVRDDDDAQQAIAESTDMIEGLNFRRVTTPMWAAEAIVLCKPRSGEPTHRVFLTYLNSPFYRSSIAVRDALRRDRELSLRFEETKVTRWRKGAGQPQRYADDKSVFFAHLIEHHAG
ncbi:dephospho-CoA kinase/protein folding accessory domain-containing protein [Stieleria maiorica]|uniref:Dephospho-CoA kinase/protein folding accessory domain-containing protein n=1 Tax=Stieleria maiorica TaxID=2795974 RepID=A0A5B9M5L6_9BACT|nr:GrpB family protein [Stieleria maiorica]QEF96421.1 dephospho-CoA kinase/protein folding accessory domain-containing protein [Stieleria maiorica]